MLAYLVNGLARTLGFILRIDHTLKKEFKTIVISKYAGIGSIIQATPLIQTLRKKFPDAQIVFVSTETNRVLLRHIPEIDEVALISDKSLVHVLRSSVALLRYMWRIKPDLYIDLEFYSNYSGIVTTLSKATNRLGFYNDDKYYRKGIYNYLVPFNTNTPISETYLQFARLVNCDVLISSLKIELSGSPGETKLSEKTGIEKGENYIVINPNASDLRLERRWPKDSYAETIKYLLNKFPSFKLVLIGNTAEASYVAEIMALIPSHPNLINSAGKITLPELFLLISGAKLMLTNDTGPMHIAFALNVKTIALFGPCSPLQYGQLANSITFYKKVHCSPCVHTHLIPPCYGDNICMKKIGSDEVKDALQKSLS